MNAQRLLALLVCVLSITSCSSDTQPVETVPALTDVSIYDENGGKAWVGDRLVGSYSIDGDPDVTVTLQWFRNEIVIDGATNPTYIVAEVDAGQEVRFEVAPTNANGGSISSAVQQSSIFIDYFRGTRVLAVEFESAQTNWAYPVRVYLPDGYQDSAKQYPVIYTLDGTDSRYNSFADILDEKAKEVILVAIGPGADFEGELRRIIDYVLPGASSYFNFITLELIPFIDSEYRSDPSNRALVGHSLGGLFAGLAMLMDTPGDRHFSSFLVQDGAFWDKPEETIALEEILYGRTQRLPVNLMLTAAIGSSSNNRFVTANFRDQLLSRNYQDLVLLYQEFNVSHAEIVYPSFRSGVDILFPKPE